MALGTFYSTSTVTPPSSDLTDFSLLVDLSQLPQSWWDEVDTSDGTKGRAAKADETELATDWIEFDDVSETGFVRVMWTGTLSSLGGDEIRIYAPKSDMPSYGPTDTYGQYNAYDDDWFLYHPSGGGENRIDGSTPSTEGGVSVGGAIGLNGEQATTFDGVDDSVSDTLSHDFDNAKGISLFGLAKAPASGDHARMMNVGNISVGTEYFAIDLHTGTDFAYWARAIETSGENAQVIYTASTPTEDTWYAIGGISHSFSDHRLYIDGVEVLTDSTDIIDQGTLTGYGIGKLERNTPPGDVYGSGTLAHMQFHIQGRSAAWAKLESDQIKDNSSIWGTWETGSSVLPGIYNQWIEPLVSVYNGVAHVGVIDENGERFIHQYNLSDGSTDSTSLGLGEVDDHNAPAVLIEDDGWGITIYTDHNGPDDVEMRTTDDGGDTWSAASTIIAGSYNPTYAQIHRISSTDRLVFRCRITANVPSGAGAAWIVIYSDDDGATWSTIREMFEAPNAPYSITVMQEDGDTIGMATADHPTGSDHTIRAFEIDGVTGDVTAWGSVLGNIYDGTDLPLDPTDGLTVFDADEPNDETTRLLDLSARMEITFMTWIETNMNVTAQYNYAKITNGSVSTSLDMVAAGHTIDDAAHLRGYFGNAVIGGEGKVALAREDNDTWIIEKWTTIDGGVTWITNEIYSTDTTKAFRPQWVGSKNVAFIEGSYTHFETYDTNVLITPAPIDFVPLTIHGVSQAGETVEFLAYDGDDLSGMEVLETTTTDVNGVATFSTPVPSGKKLAMSVHVDDNGEVYPKFVFFTDNF